MRNLLVTFLTLLSALTFAQSKGKITGVVKDKDMGLEPLPFVSVYVQGNASIGTTTDFDGNYTLPLLPGKHVIVYDFVGYKPVNKSINVVAGKTQNITVTMETLADALDAVVLTVTTNKESEEALIAEQKEAVEIVESIGAEQLSSQGVSDAAAATTKISGVQKSETSGDVFVRGLGDRYLYTSLNGLPIPSDDVDKKNINLNLFPSGIIQSVGISKTYSANSYGDQTSGHVDVVSKVYNNGSKGIKATVSSGINTNVIGQFGQFRGGQNTTNTNLGFYNNSATLTESVTNQSWNPNDVSLPIDYSVSIFGGNKYNFKNGGKLSFVGLLSHGNSFDYATGQVAVYGENSLKAAFDDAEEYQINTKSTGMANLTYEFNAGHSLSYVGLFINKLNDKLFEGGRNGRGFGQGEVEFETGVFVRDQNVKQSKIFVNQFLGKHEINDKNQIKWGIGVNNVNADEPNRIRNTVNILANSVRFVNTTNFAERKSSQEITDKEVNGFANYKLTLIDKEDKGINFNVGANTRNRKRDFASQFVGVNTGISFAGELDNFTEEIANGLMNGNFELTARPVETYEAELKVNAGYVTTDIRFGSSLIGLGLRYENDVIDLVEWNTLIGGIGNLKEEYNNVLPSFTFKQKLGEKNIFRLAASKTVTLPEFKELAPFDYISPSGNVIVGNPLLQPSTNYNLDIKWELFPNEGELVSLTGFYKLIENPINLTRRPDSSGFFTYDNTGEEANVLGAEIETKINIFETESLGKLNTSFNTTFMLHEQDLVERYQYNGVSKSGLAGASDYIINLGLTYSSLKDNEFTTTVSSNFTSDKIYSIGSPGTDKTSPILFNDEVIEKSVFTLDWIFTKKFNEHLSIKGSVKNILNPKIQRVQDITSVRRGRVNTLVKSYQKGVDIGLGVSYKF